MKRGPGPKRSPLKADVAKVQAFLQRGRGQLDATPQKRSNVKNGRTVACAREGCGVEFYRRASALAKGAKYCSRSCWRQDETSRVASMKAMRERSAEVNRQRTGAANPNYRHGQRADVNIRGGRRRFVSGQVGCAHPGCLKRSHVEHEHHVVYEQHVRANGGDRWDPRNALRLCVSCHSSHHHRGRVLPLVALRDANLQFAFELLGAGAYDYLRRYYRGPDPRLDAYLKSFTAAVISGDNEEVSDGEA